MIHSSLQIQPISDTARISRSWYGVSRRMETTQSSGNYSDTWVLLNIYIYKGVHSSIEYFSFLYTVLDSVQSPLCLIPLLSSPPVNLEESRSLKKNSVKKLCLWNYFELDLLIFFLFKYEFVIIKQPSSCSFGKKL